MLPNASDMSATVVALIVVLGLGLAHRQNPLLPLLRRRLWQLRRWIRLRTATKYVLLPAHECSEAEKCAALVLVEAEFGARARSEVSTALLRSLGTGVPVVWLALAMPTRTVVGHGCWESAEIRSAKPGGVAAANYVAKLVASGVNHARVRRRGRLFGLTPAQVDAIVDPAAETKEHPAATATCDGEEDLAAAQHPEYAPFFTMLQRGLPLSAVKQKVCMAGLNPAAIDNPDAPAPRLAIAAPSSETSRKTNRRRVPKVRTFDGRKDGFVTLSRLVVDRMHRGLGIGGALSRVGSAQCAELGADAVVGMARDVALVSFYEGLGAVPANSITNSRLGPRMLWNLADRQLTMNLGDPGCNTVETARRQLSASTHIQIGSYHVTSTASRRE